MPDVVIPYVKDLRFEYGVLEQVSPDVRRLVARNPSPFTHAGTGTYVLGHGSVAVIDPGPASREHIDNLLAGLGAERVSHILITHTHLDHSPGARLLAERTGARTYGFGPHAGGRGEDDGAKVEEGADLDFVPDLALRDGDVVRGDGWTVEAVHTPGHCSNHLCYQLQSERVLFSGDHVMGWSTSVISPPDGDMADYLRSLDKLLVRDDARFFPTHGPVVDDPKPLVRAFIGHRHAREEQILERLAHGPSTIQAMVPSMYAAVSPLLYPAAARSVYAHMRHMLEAGRVAVQEGEGLTAVYRLPPP
ncbi:MAG TPA: MBL fold metallo-hydrolase [Polyangiales bacterium]|nr:MBL fold metallo-hydrolase [Polyangiales bacterium]